MTSKSIRLVLPAQRPHWVGDGFHVFPVFAHLAFTKHISPFLMLDFGAPKHFTPNTRKQKGVGQHPHRGFETVTIAFQGEIEHADSMGNRDVIGPGDVQWMTAARGIIHEEFHSTKFSKKGGTFEMVQLWVNLPKKDKMTPPKYQPILSNHIPVVQILASEDANAQVCREADGGDGDGRVRVIAGVFNQTKGPASTFTPINLWDIHLVTPGKSFTINVPDGHNTIVFVRRGKVSLAGGDKGKDQVLGPQSVALLQEEGTLLRINTLEPECQLLLLSGETIDEPIAARGPFVMNTAQEIQQANSDFQSGKLGR